MSQPKDDEISEVVMHHWNARAATFDHYVGHGLHSDEQHKAWIELLTRLAGGAQRRVLDVGCGTGFLALMFAELGHTTTGIDLAADMLNLARDKAKAAHFDVVFRRENAASVSDPDETYDLVVGRHVIWTLPDPARAVAEWLRVLRPGGRLALIDGKWASNENMTDEGSIRSALASIVYGGMAIFSHLVGRKQRPLLFKRLYARKYVRVESQLPFFGGPEAERLVSFLDTQGLRDVTVEPLMSAALWGKVPRFPRYVAIGNR